MKAQKISNKTILVSFLTTLAMQGCGAKAPSSSPHSEPTFNGAPTASQVESSDGLFSDADAPGSIMADQEGEKSIRKRFVRIDFSILKKMIARAQTSNDGSSTQLAEPIAFRMNLFGGQAIDISFEEVEVIDAENAVIVGRIVGDEDSAVTLVMNKGVFIGNIHRGTTAENFEIRYAGKGLHSIREVAADEGGDGCEQVHDHSRDGAGSSDSEVAMDHAEENNGAGVLANPVIDVLVAYTPNARVRQGGLAAIKALIQMGIADTNRALQDSGSPLQVRLAGTLETRQNETGNFMTDLYALRSKTDRRFDEVHAERTRVGADQVTLVGAYYSNTSVAGIGFTNATYANAFTAVKASMFKQYTFTHELGHNLGLNHENGFVSSAGRFRTIIAYGNYPRIRRFSNPSLLYNGYKTGDRYRNEVAILNRNAARVSSILAPTGALARQDQ